MIADQTNYAALMKPVALELLGEPKTQHGSEWRWGNHGSLSIDVDRGVWRSHEESEGGGVLDFIASQKGLSGSKEAHQWLVDHSYFQGNEQAATPARKPQPRIVQTYDYADENGELRYQVCRMEPKSFRQRRPNGGDWSWSVKDVIPLPYRLPELLSRPEETVYIVEGEKDADNLVERGLLATCNSGGSNNWKPALNQWFNGRKVIILPDNDEAGRKHASAVRDGLGQIAASVRVVELPGLPEKGDVSDWIEAGNDVAGIEQVATDAERKVSEFLDKIRASNLLARRPPPQKFVIEGLIPEPIAAAVVAPGSTGKSFWLMQLAASVATGTPFMGHKVDRPGAVLMFGAEDDNDEISRRLHAIIDESPWCGHPLDQELVGRNFLPYSVVGEDWRLIKDGERVQEKIGRIVQIANAIDNLRLIIIDPVSRFRSGEENSNDDNTRFAEVLEQIRKDTGVTVLVAHHSRKGSTGESVDDMRGGSAFSDALRFVATLAKLKPENAKNYGIPKDDAAKKVIFRVVKSNYRTDVDEVWLDRGVGGVLKVTDTPSQTNAADRKADERYESTVDRLREVIRKADEDSKPLTRRKLRDMAGVNGVFKMGEGSLTGVVERAIQEGVIHTKRGPKAETLHTY